MELLKLQGFLKRGLSTRQIARQVGCSQKTIQYWVTKHGLNSKLAHKKQQQSGRHVCVVCRRRYTYKPSAGHTHMRCNSCIVYARKVEIKQRLIDHLGGKCVDCGFDEHPAAMQFHHKKDKDFSVAGNYNRSMDVLLKEVKKCKLVCANCHAILHARD